MRILFDGAMLSKARTGIGNYAVSLLDRLLSIDTSNEYSVIARNWDASWLKHGSDKVSWVRSSNSFKRWLPFETSGLGRNFDLYHEPNYIPRVFSGKTICTVCDMSVRRFPEYHPSRRILTFRLLENRMKKSDCIITISKNSKQEIKDTLKVPEDRIKVTYLGVSDDFRPLHVEQKIASDIRKNYNLPDYYFLYVGTIEPRKNLVRLIDAFHRFCQETDTLKIQLVFAGGIGWMYKEIFNRIRELNIGDRIVITGYVAEEHLPYVYNMATALVYPSLYEGFGLPPLEAMACGIPVIASRTSSIPEVVGDAGILVDPINTDDICKAMYDVYKSDGLRTELASRGIQRAKLFSWEKCARETLAVYNEI